MWGMGVANAKLYTDLLSERVTRSLKHKVEVNGEWYGLAPLGYLNTRDQRGKGIIVPDPVTAPLIKKLFDEYATGTYTLRQIVNQAKKWGLYVKTEQPVSKSVIDRLLKNPFYYGEMIFKDEIVPHCHEPLITRETFKKCIAVRIG